VYTLPNQPAKDNVQIALRLKKNDKERLEKASIRLNKLHPGANYSVSSIIRQAVLDKIAEIELSEKMSN